MPPASINFHIIEQSPDNSLPLCTGGCLLNWTPSRLGLSWYSSSGSSPGGRGSSSALRSSNAGSVCGVGRVLEMLILMPPLGRRDGVASCTLPSMEEVTVLSALSMVGRRSSTVITGSSSEIFHHQLTLHIHWGQSILTQSLYKFRCQ